MKQRDVDCIDRAAALLLECAGGLQSILIYQYSGLEFLPF